MARTISETNGLPSTKYKYLTATLLHVDQPFHDQEGKGWKSCPSLETNNPEIGALLLKNI